MEEFAPTALANCGKSIQVRQVWNDNLEDEFTLIQEIVDDYPFIAMDTAHTGIVLRPVRGVKTNWDYNYRALKANVDYGKVIQLGLTFFDTERDGDLLTGGTGDRCVWQFNFREFDPKRDVFENDAIELLCQAGIDFKKNMEKGIAARQFAERLMSSGAVLNDSAGWVAFHGGYDFGYLLKLLTGKSLPDTKAGFLELADVFFPTLYDVKHLMKCCGGLHGGLNKLARELKVERVGNICH